MAGTGRLVPLILVAVGWILLRSLNLASSVSLPLERFLGRLLVVLFAVTLLVETARVAGVHLRARLGTRAARARFAALAAGYVLAHALLARMVTVTPHARPAYGDAFLVAGHAFGPLTVWPHVEFAWPALGATGFATLGHAILLPVLGVVFAAAVTLASDALRARGACATGAAAAPALVTTACPSCGPALLGLLAVGGGAGPLAAALGNPASPQVALLEVAGPVIAVAAMARLTATAPHATRERHVTAPRALAAAAAVLVLLGAPLAQALGGFPRGASLQQNALYDFYVIVTIAALLLTGFTIAATVYVAARYRVPAHGESGIVDASPISRRARPWVQATYILIPTLVIFGLGLMSYDLLLAFQEPPDSTTHVEVVGQQFAWSFTYPNGEQSLNELRVQVNEVVVLNVTSADVMHNVFIPDLGVKIHANPSYVTHTWFQANEPGTYRVWCAEFCGPGHARMRAEVVVFPAGEQDRPYGSP